MIWTLYTSHCYYSTSNVLVFEMIIQNFHDQLACLGPRCVLMRDEGFVVRLQVVLGKPCIAVRAACVMSCMNDGDSPLIIKLSNHSSTSAFIPTKNEFSDATCKATLLKRKNV